MSEKLTQYCDGNDCNARSIEHPLYPTKLFTLTDEAVKYFKGEGEDITHLCERCVDIYIERTDPLVVDYERWEIDRKPYSIDGQFNEWYELEGESTLKTNSIILTKELKGILKSAFSNGYFDAELIDKKEN